MRSVNIPIRSLMPESAQALVVMPMPHEMASFEMPRLPQPGPDNDVSGACDVLKTFLTHFDAWLERGGAPPALDLAGLAPDSLRVLNETLGEGEVGAIVDAGAVGPQAAASRRPPPEGVKETWDGPAFPCEVRIQETVFPGVWREQHLSGTGVLLHDYLLAAPIPPVLTTIAAEHAAGRLRALELPAGAMNAAALLHELQEAMDSSHSRTPGQPAHVINLTLLPLSPVDTAHLDQVLDGGSVVILSRGFGNCRISSTAARHVWRVQYFNNMQTLILNTLEVVPMPEVAIAAREDLEETRERLADLVQWMGETIAAAAPSPQPSPPSTGAREPRLLPRPLAGEGRGEGDRAIGSATRLECKICWAIYDPALGDEVWQIPPGIAFAELPPHWTCPNCSAEKQNFLVLDD